MWSFSFPPKVSRDNRQIYCLVFFALFCMSCIGAGVGIGYGFRVKRYNAVSPNDSSLEVTTNRTIFLEAELISVDPLASTMVMNWYIVGDNCRDPNCEQVNIYFDNNLLQNAGSSGDSDDTPTNDKEQLKPIFIWSPKDDEATSTYAASSIFRTTSLLFNKDKNDLDTSSLQDYPFDDYVVEVFMYGNGTVSNQSVNIDVDFTEGIAVGFEASSTVLDHDDGSTYGPAYYYSTVNLRRSGLVKAYVLTIIIGVWLVTLAFVGSVMKIIFQYEQPKEVFVVPIGTLFAFTTLRGTMPGAPSGFGAIIDYVGLLPCLAVLTVTSVVLLTYLVISDGSGLNAAPPALGFFVKAPENGNVKRPTSSVLTGTATQV